MHLQVVQRTTEALGCSAEVNFFEDVHPYYPPTVNSPEAYAFAMDVGEKYALQASGKSIDGRLCAATWWIVDGAERQCAWDSRLHGRY